MRSRPKFTAATRPAVGLLGMLLVFASALATDARAEIARGRVTLPIEGPSQFVASPPAVLAEPDGSLVIADERYGRDLAVTRLLADGRADPSFGEGGVATLPVAMEPQQVLVEPDGDLLLAGSLIDSSAEGHSRELPDWILVRLLPDGAPDPTFGSDGYKVASGVQAAGGNAILDGEGRIVLATEVGPCCASSPGAQSPARAAVARLLPDGQPDPSFGSAGTSVIGAGNGATQIGLLPDGSLAVLTSGTAPEPPGAIVELTAAGRPDPRFNGGTPLTLRDRGVEMLIDAGGGLTVSLEGKSHDTVERISAQGSPDPSWGRGGTLLLPGPVAPGSLFALTSGATLMVSHAEWGGSPGARDIGPRPPASSERVVRITASGTIDPTLGGPDGLVVGVPFGGASYAVGHIAKLPQDTYDAWTSSAQQGPGGTIVLAGTTDIAAYTGEGVGTWLSEAAVARLTPDYVLDSSFGGAQPLVMSARTPVRPRKKNRISVRLTSSQAALAVVRVSSGATLIAAGTVPCWSAGATSALLRLTRAGRTLRPGRHTFAITIHGEDLAGTSTAVNRRETVHW